MSIARKYPKDDLCLFEHVVIFLQHRLFFLLSNGEVQCLEAAGGSRRRRQEFEWPCTVVIFDVLRRPRRELTQTTPCQRRHHPTPWHINLPPGLLTNIISFSKTPTPPTPSASSYLPASRRSSGRSIGRVPQKFRHVRRASFITQSWHGATVQSILAMHGRRPWSHSTLTSESTSVLPRALTREP